MMIIMTLMLISAMAFGQRRAITGTVYDATTHDPMPGVNVIIKGKACGVVTDADGKFSLTVPDQKSTLVFSFIGYEDVKVKPVDSSDLVVNMNIDARQLEEVVIVCELSSDHVKTHFNQ